MIRPRDSHPGIRGPKVSAVGRFRQRRVRNIHVHTLAWPDPHLEDFLCVSTQWQVQTFLMLQQQPLPKYMEWLVSL